MAVDTRLLRTLVVDDFANMRSTIRQMLHSIGLRDIDMASSGEEAVELLSNNRYDIILCDYNLGESKDGQQVLEEAKVKKLIGPSTIFFMITAENKMNMVMAAVEYKPDDYLTKPFTKEHLRSRLERHIARKADLGDIESAMQNEEYRRALAICEERISKAPKNVGELIKLKSEILLLLHRYDDAETVFREVLAQRNVPWAMVGVGRVQFLLRRFPAAKDTFEKVIHEHPSYMEAYDWLAKTLDKLGESEPAQKVLQSAVEKSPKAILRQQMLGEIASRNQDFETAAAAYRRTVSLGKHSVYRDSSHFSKLAKSQAKSSSVLEVVKTLKGMRKEFKGDESATLEAAVTEGVVYKDLKREREAEAAFKEASTLWDATGGHRSTEVAIDMAKVCFHFGEQDRGKSVMENVVRNNHEDKAILDSVQQVFDDAGLKDLGQATINKVTAEVRTLNNTGVGLVKSGKLGEAIDFFEEALIKMPDNPTLNLNAAQALLMDMQNGAKDKRKLGRVRDYLTQVRQLDPTNAKLPSVWNAYESAMGSNGPGSKAE